MQWQSVIVSLALLLVGIIHLIPLGGVSSAAALETLYGIAPSDADTVLLMRHRAVLFGLLGTFLVFAAWRKEWQTPAISAGFVSVCSFLILAGDGGAYGAAVQRVITADWIALVALTVAAAARVHSAERAPR